MINNAQFDSKTTANSSRKSLIERLASLRIQNSPPKPVEKPFVTSKSPESPRYIPRSTQTIGSTKSKFHNYTSTTSTNMSTNSKSFPNNNDLHPPSSPSIGRRRKLTNVSNTSSTVESSPIGMSSPKYFPKQKVFEIERPLELGEESIEEVVLEGRQHSAKEVVTSFIDSFSILNNFLNKSTNSTAAKLHLQNMNTSFAALQMDLKAAVSKISHLQAELNEKTLENVEKNKELQDLKAKKDDQLKSNEHNRELEEQLKIALSQIGEIKLAYDKERENVEFLQNYMEEVVQLKDDGEKQLIKFEKKLSELESDANLQKENKALKETIKLLEMERTSNKNACKQALEVLDAAAHPKTVPEDFQEELRQKQVEIEKLRGREQHFKESNEIFQQKLMILTEENRKLKGVQKRALLIHFPHMARLFTTKPVPDDLEIQLEDAPEVDTENIENFGNTSTEKNTMTVSATTKNKKKLNGTWLKLLTLPPQELVAELKSIHEYLSPIDQDHVDRSELVGLADKLAAPGLIKHKDRAVRVLAACCIANILRLFAPDAPYSIDQFEMIFNLFLHQLKGINEPDGIYYNYHYFLLESLSTVKTVVLIFDLPQADLLHKEIVQMALEMMHPSILKNVRLYLFELVQTLIDECDQVPIEIISDLFVPHLISQDRSASLAQIFIHDIIRQCSDKLQGPLAIYFGEQLSRVARAQESDAILNKITRDTHEYAMNVAKVSISAASSIFGLLEEELKVESPEIRSQSILALGQIFSHHHQRIGSLQGLWSNWLGRRNDRSVRCRITWVRSALEIANITIRANNLSVSDQLLSIVVERLVDPDEKVRIASIQSISSELLPVLRSCQHVSTAELVDALTERCLDRKEEVQVAALTLCSDWLFTLLSAGISANVDILIKKLIQLPFTESRIHTISFLGYLERDVFVRMAREFPDISVRAEKLTELLKGALSDERSRLGYRTLLHHKNQFLKAWTGLLKLSRLLESTVNDMHRAKIVQLCQFVGERVPGVPELEAQRALLTLPALKNSQSDSILLQMMIDLAEGRVGGEINGTGALNLLGRIESHVKATTSISLSLKRVINASLPFGSQISLNTTLIGQLTSLPEASMILADLLAEFPNLFENRTVELISGVIEAGGLPSPIVALSQYLSNPTTTASFSSSSSVSAQLLNELDVILLNLLHPPLGSDESTFKFEPKAIGAASQILINLKRQDPSELVQDLIFQLAQDEIVQIKSSLAALTGLVKIAGIANPCCTLVPHFEMIFELISQRLFSGIPVVAPVERGKKSKTGEGELLAGWPRIKDLSSDYQVPILCVRFLAAFVSSLIRQHTRKQQEDAACIDLDTISSIRSFSVGFFLTRLQEINGQTGVNTARLQYSLLKGLMTCLPDASASDLTSHLQPLFLALQDTEQRLRYKLSTLLSRLIRNRRLSDAFLPLLFFAGAHETSLLIKSTLKALLSEIIRSWPPNSSIIEELLPVLIVYTVKHPDYSGSDDDFTANRDLIKGYFAHFVENVLDSENCGTIYEAVGRLKLYHFVPVDLEASRRLYFASELAQEAIKEKCSTHHWPLQSSTSNRFKGMMTLSLLVPDILVELDEAAQLQNIHRVFSTDPLVDQSDEPIKKRIIKRK